MCAAQGHCNYWVWSQGESKNKNGSCSVYRYQDRRCSRVSGGVFYSEGRVGANSASRENKSADVKGSDENANGKGSDENADLKESDEKADLNESEETLEETLDDKIPFFKEKPKRL